MVRGFWPKMARSCAIFRARSRGKRSNLARVFETLLLRPALSVSGPILAHRSNLVRVFETLLAPPRCGLLFETRLKNGQFWPFGIEFL